MQETLAKSKSKFSNSVKLAKTYLYIALQKYVKGVNWQIDEIALLFEVQKVMMEGFQIQSFPSEHQSYSLLAASPLLLTSRLIAPLQSSVFNVINQQPLSPICNLHGYRLLQYNI